MRRNLVTPPSESAGLKPNAGSRLVQRFVMAELCAHHAILAAHKRLFHGHAGDNAYRAVKEMLTQFH
jgi:hypothetical protein